MIDSTDKMVLHPAAAIFIDEVLGDIGLDNASLAEEVSRMQPLLDYIQDVELEAVVDQEPLKMTMEEWNGVTVHVNPSCDRKIISTVTLSQGSIVNESGDERLVIPLDFTTHELILPNMGFVGGIGLRMKNQSLGFFPREPFGHGKTIISVAEDDTVRLIIFITPQMSIHGNLEGLSNNDKTMYKEGHYQSNRLDGCLKGPPVFSCRDIPDFVFTPTSISFAVTPMLRDTLSIIRKVTGSIEDDLDISPSEELRNLTIEALGDDERKKMLTENRRLKLQRDALLSMRTRLMHVDISHGTGTLTFSLNEGERVEIEGSKGQCYIWSVDLEDKESSSIIVNDVGKSVLTLSREELNERKIMQNRNIFDVDPSFLFFDDEEGMGIRLQYTENSEVMGIFNFDEFNDDQRDDILDNFLDKIVVAMLPTQNGLVELHGRNVADLSFPPSFKIKLKRIEFGWSSIGHLLKLVGLCDQLDPDSDTENEEGSH